MRLWTFQSLEVASLIWQNKVYFPDWDHCTWLGDPSDRIYFEPAYRWIVGQFQRRKGVTTSTPLVWWYTDSKQRDEALHRCPCLESVLLSADVPENEILLHDFDRWHSPLGEYPYLWEDSCHIDAWERKWDIYKKPSNKLATRETWNHVFDLPRRDRQDQTIHALTNRIELKWIQKGLKID